MFLTGEFQSKRETTAALRELQANGFGLADLDVYTDTAVEFPHGVLDRPSRMSLAAVLGAAITFILVVSFVYYAQYNYPIVTGGMPIFSGWATGVIFFEITMLGGVLCTLAVFLFESGLIGRRSNAPVPELAPGGLYVRVQTSAEKAANATQILNRAGASNIQRTGEA